MTHTAIVIQQPWAEFILAGLKTVENRPWRSTYTGVLLILAGKRFDDGWREKFDSVVAQDEAMRYVGGKIIGYRGRIPWRQGEIVGAVIMGGCDMTYNNRWCIAGQWYHRYSTPYRLAKPIPYRGLQKLFQPKVKKEQFNPADYSWLGKMHEYCIGLGLEEKDEKKKAVTRL